MKTFFVAFSLIFGACFGFYQLKKSALTHSYTPINEIRQKAQKIIDKLNLRPIFYPVNKQNKILYVHQQSPQKQMDGYQQDWQDSLLLAGGLTFELNSKQAFKVSAAEEDNYLYLLIDVFDDKIIYRDAETPHPKKADYIHLKFSEKGNNYILSTFIAGNISAINIQSMQRDHQIQGVWRETAQGYRVELRIPQNYLKPYIWINVGDVDDPELREMNSVIEGAHIFLLHQNQALQSQLENINTPQVHLRIINQQGWIIADKKPTTKPKNNQSMLYLLMSRLYCDQKMPFKPDNYHSIQLYQYKQGIYQYRLDYRTTDKLTRIVYPLSQDEKLILDQIIPLNFIQKNAYFLFSMSLIFLFFLLIGIWFLIKVIRGLIWFKRFFN